MENGTTKQFNVMCGIAGIIDYSGNNCPNETIRKMVGAIGHRGPDGNGSHCQEHVALGHTRLSIIDHAGGSQPMSTPDGQVHLTYNGEIYNFRELRSELEGLGFAFRTQSDTEVVLHAYEAWGWRCVKRFEGMFAFGIADFRKRELMLARDHFGIKPLLYRTDQSSLAFASEFQALQQLPDWTGEIDLTAIDLYLRYQYIPAPQTAFRKVFKLPAGHIMTARMGEPFHELKRYWEPDFSVRKKKRSPKTLMEELDATLRDSVQRHLVSDVPFGALLSGGIDSSLIVGYMTQILDHPVKTFSIGFSDERVNELQYARQVSEIYKTDHHEQVVEFDAMKMLPEIVRHHGEPFGDQSAIPTWAVARLARQNVPMVLSGDGGDELFAGYGSYGAWHQKTRQPREARVINIRTALSLFVQKFRNEHSLSQPNPENELEHWLPCIGRFSSTEREELWNGQYRFLTDLPNHSMQAALQAGVNSRGVNRVQRMDLETFMPEDILCKVDVASMRYGLEVRPPLIDQRVFELAQTIPPTQLQCEKNKAHNKIPLRDLMNQRIPKFGSRVKQGFELPLHAWLKNNHSHREAVRDKLTATSGMLSNWFNPAEINRTINEGRPENTWLLLALDEWLSQARCSENSAGIKGEVHS